jgi:phytoene dehydrogenase-like protein
VICQSAYVIGSGPNGLTAAIILAQAGLRTTVIEAESQIGGGTRSAELTLPGFIHDVCSAVHPLAIGSPVFAGFPLAQHGLEWIQPPLPLAHPLDDGSAVILDKSPDTTCARLGTDGPVYRRLVAPLVEHWEHLTAEILQPVLHIPQKPFLLGRFGAMSLWPAGSTARRLFGTREARALFAGLSAHSVLPLEAFGSSAFGWVLAVAAHAVGWPIPRGGSQRIANALASYFERLGGTITLNTRVRSLDELPGSALILCDVTPRQFSEMAGNRLPKHFSRQMRKYRYGPAAFKLDWALSDPIPWRARECTLAATVHVGGTLEEIAASERAAWEGTVAQRPFVLVVQPSLFDATRAPAGRHTAWAYCHVPNASTSDMTASIENQIERFAPGFHDCILARHCFAPADLEQHNANLVGGDITGGANSLGQLIFRPTRRLYGTPLERLYLCSASTPPGGGVHGMCGYHAARLALRNAGM